MISIYVDGSCVGNGKASSRGGFGVVVLDENKKIIETYSEQEENTTNNIQEIKGILWALIKYGKGNTPVTVYSDSAYCVNTFTNWMFSWQRNGWRKSDKQRPENLNLIQIYYNLINNGYKIDLKKVKGHNGNLYNELADALATNNNKKIQTIYSAISG